MSRWMRGGRYILPPLRERSERALEKSGSRSITPAHGAAQPAVAACGGWRGCAGGWRGPGAAAPESLVAPGPASAQFGEVATHRFTQCHSRTLHARRAEADEAAEGL